MSTGDPVQFDLAFKPTSTIGISQETVNNEGKSVKLEATGRHDPCVLPRAIPIVEAMSALAIMDLMLENKP
jgi:chorismate synthase